MKIVITDGHALNPGDLSYGPIGQLGELTVYPYCAETEQELLARIGEADVVIPNKTILSRRIIEQCPKLKLICVMSTGYNVIDTAAARERGIPVCNVPAYGTDMVAQFAIGLLLELCHHTWDHSLSVHSGDWERCRDFSYWNWPILELAGKTMGIIGLGRIGRKVAAIAGALGMKVIASGSRPCPEGLAVAEYVPLEELLSRSDVISLHCPLFPETEKLINRDTIAKMKDGVILINNSRGGLVDEDALAQALRSGKVAGAAVDVVSQEPIVGTNPLLTAPNCIITPHISWAATACRQRVIQTTADNVARFVRGCPQNVVN